MSWCGVRGPPAAPGFAFSPDTRGSEMEDAFGETVDQMTVIAEVKSIWNGLFPDGPGGRRRRGLRQDRIAVRAAFKGGPGR